MSDEPERIGTFKIYPPSGPDAIGWTLARGSWLPGVYADRDAVLMAIGYLLGGEQYGYLEHIRDECGDRLIRTVDLAEVKELMQ